jgi:hypothetical protein
MVWDRNEKMMVENAGGGEAEFGCRARKKIIKDGRHAGLDFYDLLIEAIFIGSAFLMS